MAKYYTDQSPTPVFAVTYVSNRDGIINNNSTNVDNNNNNNNKTDSRNAEDIPNSEFTFKDETTKAEAEDLINKINTFKARLPIIQRQLPLAKVDDNYIYQGGISFIEDEFKLKSVNSLRQELIDLRKNARPDAGTISADTNKTIMDVEYLVYSNLEIKNVGNGDLSQQSNWYLRDAEVELTRDWPICKAKLIVTCKLNDDGSIPSLVTIENGFVYNRDSANNLVNANKGRFLSADDEVRIYAGYKNETCITMNDLDQYPYSFTNLEVKNLSIEDANQLTKLETDKKKLEDAISKIGNPFFDPNFYIGAGALALTAVAIAAIVIGSAPVTVPTAVVATGASIGTAGAAATSVGVATGPVGTGVVFLGYAGGSTVAGAAGAATPVTVLTGSAVVSTNAVGAGVIGTGTGLNTFKNSVSVGSNEDLKKAFQTELDAINKLIQTIQTKSGGEPIKYTADPNKIAPIFWGFIDSVDFIGNSTAGIQIIYNLRDRSRILADTKLITIPFLNAAKDERGAFEGLRHKTIEGVYRASNGGIYLDNSFKNSASGLMWRKGFDAGEIITLWDTQIDTNDIKDSNGNIKAVKNRRRINDTVKQIQDNVEALASERIKYTAATENPARWTIANSFLPASKIKNTNYNDYDPLFHIWTLQPPLVNGSGATTMQIINKSPFEILAYMQVTEVMAIDFFTSHVNGHFMFAPRILDTTGLTDPERGNRTYFFFDCFGETPQYRSLIKDIRVTTSTIGVYNRFTVAAADFNNPTNASLTDLLSIVDIASANTKNRNVPVKQHIITDPKIAKDPNKEGAAQALALTTASTMARDNTTVLFKVIGDSSFYPGEAVRIFNTVLHSKDTFTFNAKTTTSAEFLKALYDEIQKIKNKAVDQKGDKNKVVDLNTAIETIRDKSGTPSDDLNEVLPMYKVRSITHSLKAAGNDAGFTTKIIAIADIL